MAQVFSDREKARGRCRRSMEALADGQENSKVPSFCGLSVRKKTEKHLIPVVRNLLSLFLIAASKTGHSSWELKCLAGWPAPGTMICIYRQWAFGERAAEALLLWEVRGVMVCVSLADRALEGTQIHADSAVRWVWDSKLQFTPQEWPMTLNKAPSYRTFNHGLCQSVSKMSQQQRGHFQPHPTLNVIASCSEVPLAECGSTTYSIILLNNSFNKSYS